jgi:hypothetical protein
MELFLTAIVLLIWALYREYKLDREIKAYWKHWDEISFEYKGGRYSKIFFELKDGKVVKRENNVNIR